MNSKTTLVSVALLVLGNPIWAGTVAVPSQFQGPVHVYAWWDTHGDLFLDDPRIDGTGEALVTLSAGNIQVNEIHAELPSATWTGSGSFVNPSTFQTVPISLEIVTHPTSFTISSDRSFSLVSDNQGTLEWEGDRFGFQGDVSAFRFSGNYTLRGPTETVTGVFGYALTSRTLFTEGRARTTAFPDELDLTGGFWSPWSLNDLTIVNDTVDGIDIFVGTRGTRQNMGANFGNSSLDEFTTLGRIPEPGTATLAGVALLGLMLRRRS